MAHLVKSPPVKHIKKQRHHFADKGPYSQSYGLFIGRTVAKAETPVLWPPDVLIGKDPDARKD